MKDKMFVIEKLEELLAENMDEGEVIEEYCTKRATAAGENYGSTMVALEIKLRQKSGTQRSIYTFCKMLPQEERLRIAFNCKLTFRKEMMYYLNAIPAMLQLQQENGVPKQDWVTHIVPKCYGARQGLKNKNELDDQAAILMEDMRRKGFAIGNRRAGLNLEEAKLVMEKMAVFHALPVAIKIKKPQVFKDEILETAKYFEYNADDPKKAESDQTLLRIISENIRKVPELAEQQGLEERAMKACKDMMKTFLPPVREPFSSILHNDMWVNNILFKHDEGKPKGVVFVDFQTTQLNSPFKDVIFFLFACLPHEIRQRHFDELIQTYHNSFTRCLKQVNVDTTPFSLEAAWEEINAVASSELLHLLIMLRILTADEEALKQSPSAIFTMVDLGGDLYKEKLKHVILDFVERKWI